MIKMSYIVANEVNRKNKLNDHKLSFNNRKYVNSKTLLKNVWLIKDKMG